MTFMVSPFVVQPRVAIGTDYDGSYTHTMGRSDYCMSMLICPECNSGVERLSSATCKYPGICQACKHRASSREWARRNRERANATTNAAHQRLREEVGALKVKLGCVDCGYNTHAVALDFDHMNGKTKSIAKLRSMKRVLEEIERHSCVVRCANCHRVKTHGV